MARDDISPPGTQEDLPAHLSIARDMFLVLSKILHLAVICVTYIQKKIRARVTSFYTLLLPLLQMTQNYLLRQQHIKIVLWV